MTQPLKRLLWIGLLGISLLLFASRSLAHDNFPIINNSHLDGKVANLEISLRQLQREVSKLKSQPRPSNPPQSSPTPIPQRRTSNSDPQIQNLANLIVELKQDLHKLETRLNQLEP